MSRSFLRFCGDLRVSLWLLITICFSLAAGSIYMKFYPEIFRPLKYSLMWDWARETGLRNPAQSWWLPLLFAALFVFAVNISACAADRVYSLWIVRRSLSRGVLLLKLSPSLMHFCFILMLLGHFLGACFGYGVKMDADPGNVYQISPRSRVEVIGRDCQFCSIPGPFHGDLEQCRVALKIIDEDGAALKNVSFFNPCAHGGVSIHLLPDRAFSKSPERPVLKLLVKRDRGLGLILFGFVLMIVLMLWYYPQLKKIE